MSETNLEICAAWMSHLLSTEPADRRGAEAALRDLYTASGFAPPAHFFWFDSPFHAAWAVALLTAPHNFLWKQIIDATSRVKREREWIDRVRAELRRSAGQASWDSVPAVAGESLDRTRMVQANKGGEPLRSIQGSVNTARLQLYDRVEDAMPRFSEGDDLRRAEIHLRSVMAGQAGWSTINPLMTTSFEIEYSFSMMAMDEKAVGGRTAPPVLAAAWRVARSAGLWWAFSRSAVISERPTVLHLNEQSLPHREDGPAMEYRDGSRIWAWNGRAMREEWIMHPETVSARDLKKFEPSFQAYVAARVGTVQPKARQKPSSILKKDLPRESEERVAFLRLHNAGQLPLFGRYLAGEHEKVWAELITLGAAVREDPYAADALAVAYETMTRVAANVRTITARVKALGYESDSGKFHEPPGPKAHKQTARLEKSVGALPLSLRAFYEVVGAVDWMGEHKMLAPRNDSVAPDPLVVFPIEDALQQSEEGLGEEEGAITIAPDDLQKANTSGGDPYQIGVPECGADGKLLNERHDLYFVAYLRLVFRYGGFPGYEDISPVPAELEELRQGLTAF